MSEQVLDQRIKNDPAYITPRFGASVHIEVQVAPRHFRSHEGTVLHAQITQQQLVLPLGHGGGAGKELGVL